ncbi:pyridoxal-phosphate dependent enzyme [Yinghuangia aomiensis]
MYLKCENLQRTGSFKIRGAYVRIAGLSESERARGVVAASAGNHAQGVALAAQQLGVRSTVFMPVGAPLPKIAATRGYGAEVLLEGTTVEHCPDRRESVRRGEPARCSSTPSTTRTWWPDRAPSAWRSSSSAPEVRTIVVGTGGGGLLAGVAAAVKAVRPDVKVVGVQAASAAAYPPSLAAGHPVVLPSVTTMADGIAVGRPGDVPFGLIRDLVDEVRTVSEESLSQALLLCMERVKLVVEPAGAASVAALLESADAPLEAPVVAVLSGGNVDPLLMLRVLRHGLAAAGRYLSLRIRLPDRPGALATLLAELAGTDANVVDVAHVRTDASLQLGEVEVELHLETKGTEHCRAVVARMSAAGYPVSEG